MTCLYNPSPDNGKHSYDKEKETDYECRGAPPAGRTMAERKESHNLHFC